jgi:exopolysaccharide biosynthesis polyprenyl glycosylphosphotransferase
MESCILQGDAMIRRFSVDFAIFMMIMDSLIITSSLWLAVTIRPELDEFIKFAREINISLITIDPLLYPVFSVMWVLVLLLFSVYDTRKNFRFANEMTNITLGSFLASISLAGLLYLSFREISRALFGSFVIFAFTGIVMARVCYRLFFKISRNNGVQARRVLVLGAGEVGQRLQVQVDKHHDLGFEFAGYLDDDPQKSKIPQVLGKLDESRDVILNKKVNDVVLALPTWAFHKVNELIACLHDLPVRVWVVPDYFALALHQARIEEMAGIPMIDLRAPALNEYQLMVKRAFDLIVTITTAPIVLPIIGLIALLIRLDSRGVAIFTQERVGENGRIFKMYKFRTMIDGAEKDRHYVEKLDPNGLILQDKTQPDPRITRLGRILRKTSLDELPQLFNVIRGEMSLVGPRPEMPYLVEQYQPWQRCRFAVPQGMTGWWQINGRSDKPMHQNTQDDLYYVQNYSIWLDMLIILKTVWVVLRRKGAY